MESENACIQTHETKIISLLKLPGSVNGRAIIPLKFQAVCANGCAAFNGHIIINDEQGNQIAESIISGDTNETEDINISAPAFPREYAYNVTFRPAEDDELHGGCSLALCFTVKPHIITLNAWGVPLPVNKGEEFIVKIGARCSGGCELACLPYIVLDGDTVISNGILKDELLPQTSGTYWAEQSLTAPNDEAVHVWSVDVSDGEFEFPHQVESAEFTFRTAAPPSYNVTVTVTDKYLKHRLEDANVMLGIFKGRTNNNGVAILRVSGGIQELRLSKLDYVSSVQTVDITGDCEIEVPLEFYPET